jgi:hypothetical protein
VRPPNIGDAPKRKRSPFFGLLGFREGTKGGFTRAKAFAAGEEAVGKMGATGEVILNPTEAPLGVVSAKELKAMNFNGKGFRGFATGTGLFDDIKEGPQGNLDLAGLTRIADALRTGDLSQGARVGSSRFNLMGDQLTRRSVFGAPAFGGSAGVGSISSQTSRVQTPLERERTRLAAIDADRAAFDAPTPAFRGMSQEQLIGLARQFAPPRVKAARAGKQPAPRVVTGGLEGFRTPTLRMLSSLTKDDLGALNTLLNTESEGLTDLGSILLRAQTLASPGGRRGRIVGPAV